MKKYWHILLVGAFLAQSCHAPTEEKQKSVYPVTQKVDTVDEYFGAKVPDPYRWLEDDRSAETGEWVKKQNDVTFAFLKSIPYRDQVKKRLEEIWNHPKYSTPFKSGGQYFFYKNDGLQNQSMLYTQKDLNAEPEALLNPNSWSTDGTIAMSGFSVSKSGQYAAYSIAEAGSDWNKIVMMELSTRKTLPDTLKWIKFSGISWKGDGFYYSRYDSLREVIFLRKTNITKCITIKLVNLNQKTPWFIRMQVLRSEISTHRLRKTNAFLLSMARKEPVEIFYW